jgi:MSHA biogenesis protein MshQ
MTETRQASTGGAAQVITINSIAPSSAAAGTQYERGLMAVNGRLQVGNALGSEALRLPVALTAQYWNGSNWLTNTADNDSLVAATAPWTGSTPAPACSGALAANPPATACKSGVVTNVNNGTAIRLSAGRATMVLQQPAPGRLNGSIDYQVTDGASSAWLPSTQARAKFGLYKAPVIYLREVY